MRGHSHPEDLAAHASCMPDRALKLTAPTKFDSRSIINNTVVKRNMPRGHTDPECWYSGTLPTHTGMLHAMGCMPTCAGGAYSIMLLSVVVGWCYKLATVMLNSPLGFLCWGCC
mmetsp:Transcript_36344/g.80884  ORF Transcript_36344/g.80884 Transcript_36344/m.80884 type:complete len:114 (-) Transcript_36344:1525-1866(-)